MEIFFWISLLVIVYTYFGYVILLALIYSFNYFNLKKRYRVVLDKDLLSRIPNVSFIITAYNEERQIKEKLDNTLALDFDPAKLEILVASDCSNDNTDQIIQNYASKGIKLVRSSERKGKEYAQMCALKQANGEILIFSDVATILEPNAIYQIISNFKDRDVGCVSSVDRFVDNQGQVSTESLYVKYEMFLRNLESKVNTIVGMSGSFFAARRKVCMNWALDLPSDFNTLINTIKLGLKGKSDPLSIGCYKNIADEHYEFQRKVRTVLRGIAVLMRNKKLLNPLHFGLFSLQMLSHKLLRWLIPYFLIFTFVTNVILALSSSFYTTILIIQLLFYCGALIYYVQIKSGIYRYQLTNKYVNLFAKVLQRLMRVSYYFVTVNISIFIAWIKYLTGQTSTTWEPTKR